jgi:hypothetical protein
LLGVALTRRQKRPEVVLWLGTWLLFLLLAAGPVLRFNGEVHNGRSVLPASFSDLVSAAFAPWVRPTIFCSACCCRWASWRRMVLTRSGSVLPNRRSPRRGRWRCCWLIPLLMFELWNGPYPRHFGRPLIRFTRHWPKTPSQFALIELPLGRQESKIYQYYQTVHEKPLVEGLSARTPQEAYRYINANALLRTWDAEIPLDCSVMGEELDTAVAQLLADNFRYVIVHHFDETEYLLTFFEPYEPLVQDAQLTVYELSEVAERPFCP